MAARPKILGVDDSLTIRKALEIVLKPAGYDLDLATDGAEALAKAKTAQPALILLDFILPDMRGTDVCRQLAADPETAHIPVVLISAKGAEIEQAYRDVSNVVSYIAKPFKPPVLTGIVAEVLSRAAGELVKLDLVPESAQAPSATQPHQTPSARAVEPVLGFATETTSASSAAAPSSETAAGDYAIEADDLDQIDVEAFANEQLDDAAADAARRERTEWMFETLRSSLEGVYVEEVDTPTGAAADQAKTYTDLIEQLSRQLEEGLHHARTGARYRLYNDGSIRSFDEALLDVFRRSCRVLLRAAAAGAGAHEPGACTERVLIACQRKGAIHDQLQALLAVHPEWSAVMVAENFRQLPLLVRLYGPSVLVAEMTWTGALWDQLRIVQRLPEAQGIRMIGVADPMQLSRLGEPDRGVRTTLLAEVGCPSLVASVFEIEKVLISDTTLRDDQAANVSELLMAV